MKNRKRILILTLAVLMTAAAALSDTVSAAVKTAGGAKAYTLKLNKTYRKYDITGDGKADKILVKADVNSEGYISTMSVRVNGKNCLTKTYYEGPDVNNSVLRAYPQVVLFRLKNKKPFLYIHFSTYNGYYAGGWVYRYKSKKLQQIVATSTLIQKYMAANPNTWRAYEILSKVSGNQVWFTIGSTSTDTSKTYKLKYKSGKLK